ncbi:protein WEAK CHLOROPLAST MOVEMENT UNDER BLUE LIGHT 1 isoform X1 [Amborella trichopoda]|uniref:Uncharacterized protein n=1 Tax=Amborella trichopoda TaxID=13333 RepID=W1PPQ5_AMBTC|nr:protein WEAK CHLOROPLAST MOVEMENT UNDER BLUE LIGHT 1 isoform X1 [Amborella trichopoda]ERN09779.1 hypothetical protein AMTR_s00029p00240470 [Amborella trichopoda]|eukprot:XP_020525341.1 protein WEAK CHLOROPLAST MOVEMENT UNDER BLUE LIGHT 1 isoform X1 [Amborella trichopoda]
MPEEITLSNLSLTSSSSSQGSPFPNLEGMNSPFCADETCSQYLKAESKDSQSNKNGSDYLGSSVQTDESAPSNNFCSEVRESELVPSDETKFSSEVRESESIQSNKTKFSNEVSKSESIQSDKPTPNQALVDGASPFESVKEAVTKFEGVIDWKARKVQTMEQHGDAISTIKSARDGLETLRLEYASLLKERDMAIEKAEEAMATYNEIEKTVQELISELIAVNESLESAHAELLEREDRRMVASMAKEQELLKGEMDMKIKNQELERLKAELESYKEARAMVVLETSSENQMGDARETSKEAQTDTFSAMASADVEAGLEEAWIDPVEAMALARKELNEVMSNIKKAKDEVQCLRVAAFSLKSELEREKAALMQQREGRELALVLRAELDRITSETETVLEKEGAGRQRIAELPSAIQIAALEADQAKSSEQLAHEDLMRVRKDAEQAKGSATTMEARLIATIREIEASKASERLALAAIEALDGSSQNGVTLSLDQYFEMSKRAYEAEEQASARVAAAFYELGLAKESELRSLEREKEAKRDLGSRKEALCMAVQKREKAMEEKLVIEEELRKWRTDQEELRRMSGSPSVLQVLMGDTKSLDGDGDSVSIYQASSSKTFMSESDDLVSTGSEFREKKRNKKKKKTFFPQIITFLARRNSG